MPSNVSCPYQDRDCPKIEDMENEIRHLHKRVAKIEQITYIIVGMIAIDYGLVLF